MIMTMEPSAQFVKRHRLNAIFTFLLLCVVVGCVGNSGSRERATSARIEALDLNDIAAVGAAASGGGSGATGNLVRLNSARNEWVDFAVQISGLSQPPRGRKLQLRIQPLNLTTENSQIAVDSLSAYQIVNMPIDVNRAGYVRHTGLSAARADLPRALLPLEMSNGLIDLSTVRDPKNAADPKSRALTAGQPMTLWFDLHVPPEARPGDYVASIDIIDDKSAKPFASVNVDLNVYDFVLSDERHLQMVGNVDWSDLTRLFPASFERATPRLVSRTDAVHKEAVRTLDQLVTLAQDNRVQVAISRLQPTVKWPTGRPPQVDWTDYDSLVMPWLRGDVFRDKIPVGYWPLPEIDNLANYDARSQRQYWSEAAAHFDQLDWLSRSSAVLHSTGHGRVDSAEALKLSGDAGQILALNQRLRVEVPLEDDQVQFINDSTPNLVRPDMADRLITANPALVFSSPIRSWPNDVKRPARWLRTDLTGVIPYVGAGGDERDVRLWAWLAYVPLPPPPTLGIQYGPVQIVKWPSVLPRVDKPSQPADPNDLIWFYPGSWFGLDEPVASVQLKWLRRAQQDFEYLYLAKQRGEALNALVLARLMSKPVELAPTQQPDPTFGLMSGTADDDAWNGAIRLLAQRIMLRVPGQPVDEKRDRELNLDLGRWADPQERPVAMGRSVSWKIDSVNSTNQLVAELGIDIYNDADRTPDGALTWTGAPPGWHYRPQPTKSFELATYHVRRIGLDATLEPTEIKNLDHQPLDIVFTDDFSRKQSPLHMVLPAAFSDRREGRLLIDGSLDDWSPDDLIQNGPMVRMFSRPGLQKQEIQSASSPTNIYTSWAEENFYVAFKMTGLSGTENHSVRNDVRYEFRRAWGEDLGQLIVQAVYPDNTLGPVMQIVIKPGGQIWIERKMNDKEFVDPWQAYEGTGTRYATWIDGPDWRGELAIPWKAIADPAKPRPAMLRFNFTQHKNLTGESASWAGPIDFGRDENFTGVLIIREPSRPGM